MSGYALLKRPLGGPWNASKEIQRTGRRLRQINKSNYGPPHVGQVGKTCVSAVPALRPLKRYCKSAPRTWRSSKANKAAIRPPHQNGTKNPSNSMKNNSSSILYPRLSKDDSASKRLNVRRESQYRQTKKSNGSAADGCAILCIGDSFTSGKRGRGTNGVRLKNAPYFKFLESRLVDEAKKSSNPRHKQWKNARIMYDAASSDLLKDTKTRLERNNGVDFQFKMKSKSKKFERNKYDRTLPDVVILFAGLNDLMKASRGHEKTMLDDILAILSAVATLNIQKCIICTIPEVPKEIEGSCMNKTRMKLNQAIRAMHNISIFPSGSDLGTEPATKIVICDISERMKKDSAKISLKTWSGDGLHMKLHGHERVANYIYQTLIKTSGAYINHIIGRQKYERQLKQRERSLRKTQAKKAEVEELKKIEMIHQDLIRKRKQALKARAMVAGAPARECRWMRIADEESRSFEAYFMKEAERLAEMRQKEKERKETELMEEEDRLVRVYVRHLKKIAREEAKLVKIDNVIIKLVSKRVYLTKAKLIASLFAVLPYPVPGKTIQQRINGLMQSSQIERDKNFPEILFHRPAMEKYFRAKLEKEKEERRRLHEESLAAVKDKVIKTAEENKMESYADRLARLGRDNV